LAASAERDRVPAASELVLDLLDYDALNADSSLVGEFGVFDSEFVLFGDGYVKAKALDDRAGCAVLLKLLQSERFERDVYYVFTVQEEVGTRGAAAVANRLNPETVIVVESTTAADYPGRSDSDAVCRLDKGAVLPFMDGGAIYDAKLWQSVTKLADKHGIAWQTKHRVAGGTDARAFQQTAFGAKVVAISLPTRNIHSPSCVAKLSDLDAVLALCKAVVRE
jgi:endoglucanase